MVFMVSTIKLSRKVKTDGRTEEKWKKVQYSGRPETAKSHLGRVPYCRHMDIASPSPGVDRTIKIERHPACLFESSAASGSVWWWMECNQGHLLSQPCLSTSRESSSQAHGRLFELKSKLTRVINCRGNKE